MDNLISAQFSFFISLLFLVIGAAGSLVFMKNDKLANWWGNGLAIIASVFGLASSLSVLFGSSVFSYQVNSAFSFLSFSFQVDKLSAFFIFLISFIALLASIYALGYVKHFYKKYNLGALGFFYNIFLAGMLLVASAHNAFFFLIVWEKTSLASYFLVIFENKEKENIKAGSLYFVMTHVGTAFIILAFLLLYQATGSFDFGIIKENIGNISLLTKNLIFVCALIGFGTKAGIIPFHIWLPSAHPVAPTHVSALMSGVMIKTGIYMLVRILMDLLPGMELWWGILILVIGMLSSLLGVLYALTEHDIKKLLAYHSIENIGIILLGLGSALVFLALDMKALAVLGLVAALFHTLNHATFKALLFLGAGSVISKTHTRNMEEYGGLIKYMPQTAFFFLIGSMAISALPPFNGFFSEWMTFQALFSGIQTVGHFVGWVFILAAGALAFTGGLAAACFVKAFGVSFLARPRSEEVKHAKESELSLRIGMGVLALATLILGIFSGSVAKILTEVVSDLQNFQSAEKIFSTGASLFKLQNSFAAVSLPMIFAALLVVLVAIYFAVLLLTKNRKVKVGVTWDCGTNLGPRMEITATGFSRSIITIFRGILKPSKQTDVEYRDADMRYFPKDNTIKLEIKDVYGAYFYQPVQNLVAKLSTWVKAIQNGNLNAYVAYIFFTLVILLLILVI